MPVSPAAPRWRAWSTLRPTKRPARTPPRVAPRAARAVVEAVRPSPRNTDMTTILNHPRDLLLARRGTGCRGSPGMRNNGHVTRTSTTTRSARPDQVLADAVDVARQGLDVVDPDHVGEHLGVQAEGERLVTHFFACGLPGYRGWRWAVTITRVSRRKQVTICGPAPLPGPDALLAPAWVPWQDRLQPGDLGVGDLLPTAPDDDRLAPGYLLSDDPAVEDVSWELGLGRARVLSREGRMETAQRWYDGENGPQAAI